MQEIKFEELRKREVPRKTTHNFIGGSLDGTSQEALEHYVLTDKVIVTINDENYKFVGEDTFQFIGKTSKKVFVEPTKWQILKLRFLKWLLT